MVDDERRTPLRISIYAFLADFLMAVFVVAVTTGTWIEWGAGYGLLALGVASGLVAFVLGND